jgi:small-conductance mechanosensitive channel
VIRVQRAIVLGLLTAATLAGERPFSAQDSAAPPAAQPAAAQAATAQPIPAQPSPAPPAPAPIPLASLVSAADEASRRLLEIRSAAEGPPLPATLESGLPEAEATLTRLKADLAQFPLPGRRLGVLDNLRQQWLLLDGELSGWADELRAGVAGVEALLREAEGMRAVWELTAQAAVRARAPRVQRERIRGVQEGVASAGNLLKSHLDTLAAVGARVGGMRDEVGGALAEIDAARSRARQELFTIDSPPLWRALAEPAGLRATLGREIREAWIRDVGTLRDYLGEQRWRRRVHLVLFLSVAALILVLRRHRAAAGSGAALEAYDLLLDRPVSASLVVALIGSFFIYRGAPVVLYELTLLALLAPLLRLLPGLAPAPLRGSFYGLAVLCFLDGVADLSPEGSRLQRLLLFAITLLALAGLGWLLRRGGVAGKVEPTPGWRAALACSRLGFVVLAVSLATNLVGNFSLSRLLTRATLNSAYLAVALYGGVVIVDTLLQACVRSPFLRALRMVAAHGPLWERRGRGLVRAAALLSWAAATLVLFQLMEPLRGVIGAAFGKRLTVGSLSVSFGDVVVFGLAVWVSTLLSRLVAFVLEEDVLSRMRLARGVPEAVSTIVRYSIVTAGLFMAFAAVGLSLDRLAIIVGALGVGVGFGLQHAVNNVVSGLILVFERPVRLGDTVAVGTLMGRVSRIGPRSSTLETFEGAEVIVPNGNLLASELINWTLSNRVRRVEVRVGVAYGTDPRRVLELLSTAARRHPQTLASPEPVALFRGFGESSLDFTLLFWVGDIDSWMQVQSDVALAIHDALREAGIEIPFPQRDVRLRQPGPTP